MGELELPVTICVGEFYLLGEININDLAVIKKKDGYSIEVFIKEKCVKRIDDIDLRMTKQMTHSNVLQINFKTGEKKWV
jgi:hypothetical protein